MTDLISRADAIEEISKGVWNVHELVDRIKALPSADAKPKMTEEVREALMRLTMCAREECAMCKYKEKCGFEFQYNISTENMNTLLDALSDDAVQGWIPCSERLPIPPTFCLVTTDGSHGDVIDIALYMSDGWHKASEVIAWMPLPKPYKGGDTE